MRLIICVDDDGGILFFHKRVSRDRKVYQDIHNFLAEDVLWMSHYSEVLFSDISHMNIQVSDEYMQQCPEDSSCFAERDITQEEFSEVTEVVLYRWNRKYPSDEKFTYLSEIEQWTQTEYVEFPGYSHDMITKEVYVR